MTWAAAFATLTDIRGYADDWDGDGATAPDADTLANADATLRLLRDVVHATPPRVSCGVNGTVSIEWLGPGGYAGGYLCLEATSANGGSWCQFKLEET